MTNLHQPTDLHKIIITLTQLPFLHKNNATHDPTNNKITWQDPNYLITHTLTFTHQITWSINKENTIATFEYEDPNLITQLQTKINNWGLKIWQTLLTNKK